MFSFSDVFLDEVSIPKETMTSGKALPGFKRDMRRPRPTGMKALAGVLTELFRGSF